MSEAKTNAMRELERAGIKYRHFTYDPTETEGVKVAALLGQDETMVFKTLVTVSGKKVNYVFVIPVAETLDLKAAARAVGEKSVEMIKQKELLPLTGYIHGGCSPVGMKKHFRTVIHESAQNLDTIFVSAGRVGNQVEVEPKSLAKLVGADFADIIMHK